MNAYATESIIPTAEGKLPPLEIIKEADTQALTHQFLQQLQYARCWQRQTLAEAANQIQTLLQQLEETHPTATRGEQEAFINRVIPTPQQEQFLNALQAGWQDMMQEFLEQRYLSMAIAILEGWKQEE